ncbi:hypothetical protein ACFPVX_00450 [Cohnella faecalis]|uniref:hypothetical protein n=1 Tax=Cohnella faecalis TaxID=2315694 RepID=UPI0018F3BF02|nr:hypothetical protein [Cohnella faecalis]
MPIIPNFPERLLEEHKRWHHARHSVDITRPPSGYGLDFLQFHRNYIRKAIAWYVKNGGDAALVAPWTSVPEEIRRSPCYDVDAERRILTQPETFATADELGRFIESSGLHGCMHQQLSELLGEPEINDFDTVPRHTEFYNIHGMVERWYQNWEGMGRFRNGLSYWCGKFDSDEEEVLYYRPSDGIWWLGRPRQNESRPDVSTAYMEWEAVGDSEVFGRFQDGRPFRVWDTDGDGKHEILFYDPPTGNWQEGKIKDGRLEWTPVRLLLQGLSNESISPRSVKESKNRNTST